MPIRRRRTLALVFVALLGVATAVVTGIVAAGADAERIDGYWVGAVLTDDGLRVTEVIDYDFGPNQRRGIFRDVPDLVPGSVTVSSPTAPDDVLVTEGFIDTEIRIGDPSVTISGRHRYRIDYLLDPTAVQQDGLFSFDAIGSDWAVPITDVQVSFAVPGGLGSPTCAHGEPWDSTACAVTEVDTGRYTAEIGTVRPGEGVTVSGSILGGDGTAPAFLAPSGPAIDPGAGILLPATLALGGVLVGGVAATLATRRAGRERVWSGGAADAAYGEEADGLGSGRLDEMKLAAMATIEFEPPRDTSAVEGGLLLQERVRDEHLAAWLLESAIRGEITIDGDDDPVIGWGPNAAHPSVHQVLDAMFDGRSSITLDEYDKDFSEGWSRLEGELKDWLHGSPHWDETGRRRQTRARVLAVLGLLVGGAIGAVATVFAAWEGGLFVVGTAAGALIVGVALGTIVSSYELLVRTETGSAMWLRIESFRRFLENSEARHVDEAAEKGVLRQYTAWAVALGESAAWSGAVDAAARSNPELRSTLGRDLAFVHVGSSIVRASSTASTAPSSSGSGGFSGGVGGGGGGGGGGSW